MGTTKSPSDTACAQCGRPIYAGTPYVTPFGHGTPLCGKKCLNEWEGDKKKEAVEFSDTMTGKALSGAGKLAGKGWKSFNSSLDEIKERNDNQKAQIQAKALEVSKFSFSSDANELKNEIEELIIMRKSLKAEELPVKKAIYDKLQFGLERLRQHGEQTEFFAEKIEKMKPSVWEKINHFISTN